MLPVRRMDSFNKAVSIFVVYLLDRLGYSQEMIEERRKCYQREEAVLGSTIVAKTVVGSKGEGLTSFSDSDLDKLSILNGVLCCEKERFQNYRDLPEYHYIFTVNTELASPGYALLFPSRHHSKRDEFFERCVVQFQRRNPVLSSSLFWKSLSALSDDVIKCVYPEGRVEGRAGPAVPVSFVDTKTDLVYSLPCECPTILHEWLIRQRPHDWPSWEVRVDVVSLGANLCPVGCKQDEFHNVEWRFCFNLGEMKLVKSWNESQTKLYVILKMLLKEHLKPENTEITSYTVKNIVFWLCEMYPQSRFTPDSLLQWLRKALQMLRQSIHLNMLPYYMIPSRNLLKGLDADTKKRLTTRISKILQDPLFVFQFKKIQVGTALFENGFLDVSGFRRDMAERLLLDECCICQRLQRMCENEHPVVIARLLEKLDVVREYRLATVTDFLRLGVEAVGNDKSLVKLL